MTKLYEIPRGSKIKIPEGIVTFHKLDGMYSYCTCDWLDKNNVVHFSAVMPLVKVGDYYEVVDEKS